MKKSLLLLSFVLPSLLFAQQETCVYALNENDKFLKVEKKELAYVKYFEYYKGVSFTLAKYGDTKYLVLDLNLTNRDVIPTMYCNGDKLFLSDAEENIIELALGSESGKDCSHGKQYKISSISGVKYKLYFPLSKDDLEKITNFNVTSFRLYNSDNTYFELDRPQRGLHFGGVSKKKLPEYIKKVENMFSAERINCLN